MQALSSPMSSHPQRQRGNAVVWILVLLILAGAGFAGWWFFLRGGASGNAPALLNRAIPAEATAVIGVDPQAVLKSKVVGDLLAATGQSLDSVKAQLATAKVDLDTFQAVIIGLNPADESGVLATQGKLDVATLKGAVLAASIANPKLAEVVNTIQFEGLDDGLVVAGRGDVYTKALAVARGQSTGGLDPKIGQIAGAVDMEAAIWAAGAIPADAPVNEGMVTSQLGGTPTHAALSIDPGDTLTIRVALLIPGADGAKAAANIKAALGLVPAELLPPGAGDVLKSLELDGAGEILKGAVKLDAALLASLAKLAN